MNAENLSPRAELEDRLRFETLIADLSSKFVNLPTGAVDREIMDAERRICEILGLDVSVLWQLSDETPNCFTVTHYYSVQEGPQPPGRVKVEDFPWFLQQLLAGRIVSVSSLDELPPEAARDREVCREVGIKSSLTIPLSVGGQRTFSVLGLGTTLAERDWPAELVKRLQLVAQIFANALERKRAEQALREGELRLNLAAEAAEAGLWALDVRTQIFWVTDRTRAIFGLSADEVVSMERIRRIIHPDDWKLVEGKIEGALHAADGAVDAEYRIRLGDGCERWVASRGRPVFKSSGEPERLLGLTMDITERKRTEEALRVSEVRLAAGSELAGLGYYEVDYIQRTCFLDDRFREICGIPPDVRHALEPVEFWINHVHRDDVATLMGEREKLRHGTADRISAEYRYLHPTQGQKWFHHSARSAACDDTGSVVRTYGVIRDITPQKRAEIEAQELRGNLTHLARVTMLGALSGSLAHELNQPLGIILSNAQAAQELLLQGSPDLGEVQAILSDIVAADRRAGDVIERLRALFKRGEVSLQPLALNGVIDEVLNLTRADLIGRGVTVVRELAPQLPPVAGDRVQLQQLVLNIILNAADAMAANAPGTRRLHLQTTLHQGLVRTSVRDEGSGLATDVERLFQPLYTTKPSGLGMGLAICRSIVEAHSGRLWAEPHPERGAVFHFELPIAVSMDKP